MFPFLSARRSQGTIGAPGATLLNDILLRVGGGGYSGTWAATNNAQIDFKADGNHTNSSQPTRMEVSTTPPNSITGAVRFTVGSSGGNYQTPMTTAQRNAIPSPQESLIIYNSDTHAYEYWNGTAWKTVLTN